MILEAELKALIKKYSLTQEELYRYNDTLMLMNARGIRKIITTEKLNISKRVVFDAANGVVVITRVEKGSAFLADYSFYEAAGEAKPGLNTVFRFPVAVAESRANGRAVLMWAGLYEKGIISESEMEQEVEAEGIVNKRKEQAANATEKLVNKVTRRGA